MARVSSCSGEACCELLSPVLLYFTLLYQSGWGGDGVFMLDKHHLQCDGCMRLCWMTCCPGWPEENCLKISLLVSSTVKLMPGQFHWTVSLLSCIRPIYLFFCLYVSRIKIMGVFIFIFEIWRIHRLCTTENSVNFRDKLTVFQNTHTHNHLRLSGFFPGQPRWASIRRNNRPLTPIMVINHPLSASSIYYDPWHLPCSIYVPDSLFHQSLSKFSLVYFLAWHPPLHTPYISSPNHCLLFAASPSLQMTSRRWKEHGHVTWPILHF